MKFICEKGQFLELDILDYEYPDIVINKDDKNWFKDSNWLMIHFNVNLLKLQWNINAPVLNIYDIKYMIDWFKDISKNKIIERKAIDFIDPGLSLKLLNNFNSTVKIMKFKLEYPIHPANIYANSFRIPFKKYYFLKLKATNERLRKYAEELENELKKYPDRG